MKIFTTKEILPIAFILLVVSVGILLYPFLPDKIPSHWNARGEIDAWSGRNFTVIFYPALILGIYLLMILLPLIDPLRRNYLKFSRAYFWIRTVLVLFFAMLYFYTLWTVLGGDLNINYFIIPAIFLLFLVIGVSIPKIKKNYFVGIRTPWTLYSEEVWDRTHQFGGKFFILAGFIILLALFFPEYYFQIILAAVIVGALIPVAYSYIVFRRIEKSKGPNV
jgi:uncharacterized membrane protein